MYFHSRLDSNPFKHTHSFNLLSSLSPSYSLALINEMLIPSSRLHGFATPVTDGDEKMWAMEKITNAVVPTRWENSRIPPTKTEITSTQIIKVKIADASAKVRTGPPGDDKEDLKDEELRKKVWIGVVPTWITVRYLCVFAVVLLLQRWKGYQGIMKIKGS